MRLVYALPFVLLASAAMAQAPQQQVPPAPEDQLTECSSQLAIRQDYLAQDEHSIIVLRSAITRLQNQIAGLQKTIEEQKKKEEKPEAKHAPESKEAPK